MYIIRYVSNVKCTKLTVIKNNNITNNTEMYDQ